MEWTEISVRTSREAVEAVSEAFYSVGSGGVVVEEPGFNADDVAGDWNGVELPDSDLGEDEVIIKGYLPVDERTPAKVEELRFLVDHLRDYGLDCGAGTIDVKIVCEDQWSEAWKAYYKPVKIGRRLWIKPQWEDLQKDEGTVVIELDPGMAFGTGTHPTTVMCLEWLEKLVQGGETVFDIGTGSGILAIAVLKLGAQCVRASDIDPVAVRVARQNAEINEAAQGGLTFVEGGIEAFDGLKADLVVANIIAAVIMEFIPQIPALLNPGGVFVASGILNHQLSMIKEALKGVGMEVVEHTERDDWVALAARKRD